MFLTETHKGLLVALMRFFVAVGKGFIDLCILFPDDVPEVHEENCKRN